MIRTCCILFVTHRALLDAVFTGRNAEIASKPAVMSNLSKSMDETSTYGQHLWAHGHTLRPTMLSPHSPSRSRSRSPSLERRQQSFPKSPRSPRPERRMILGLQSHSASEASFDHPQKRRLVLKSSHQSWPSSTKRYVSSLSQRIKTHEGVLH